jgi:hypothetical protein
MARSLDDLSDEAATIVWGRWLADYWSDRLAGVPRQLSVEESSDMLDWAIALKAVFSSAVEKVCHAPAPLTERAMFFASLRESTLLQSHSEDVLRLVGHVLQGSKSIWYECGFAIEVVKKLHASLGSSEKFRPIVESLVRLGCGNPRDLETLIG